MTSSAGLVGVSRKKVLVLRPHRVAPGLEIAAVHQRRSDAEARQIVLDDVAARAEHGLGRDDVVAGFELADQRQRDCGHAGRGGARGFGAFERRHAPLEHVDGRIGKARILIAGILALEAGLRLRGGVVDVALGEKQRFRGLAERRAQRARLNQTGFRAVGFLRGRGHVALLWPNKNPAGRKILGPGSRVPGLLAIYFTWLQAGRLK